MWNGGAERGRESEESRKDGDGRASGGKGNGRDATFATKVSIFNATPKFRIEHPGTSNDYVIIDTVFERPPYVLKTVITSLDYLSQ